MIFTSRYCQKFVRVGLPLLAACLPASTIAAPLFQPPGANLVYGDVTHGQRLQSASTNPAAAAADYARSGGKPLRGTVVSASVGVEAGNVQNIFDAIDELARGFEPSESGPGSGAPGQEPEDKPEFGLDLGAIWDSLDPDVQAAVNAAAAKIATQAAALAVIVSDAYAKAWVAADAPLFLGNERWGGTWSLDLSWWGAANGYGVGEPIQFDADVALQRLEDWLSQPSTLPVERIPLSEDVLLKVDELTGQVGLTIQNDSSFLAKAAQATEFDVGYSRPAYAGDNGSLYLGAKARLYLMRLSRFSVRLGDITDAEELLSAIRDSAYSNDTRVGIDVGALWTGRNYQLGAQLTNINEPTFTFPEVDVSPYTSETFIRFLESDRNYTMDRQLKLEASVMSENRRWSAHAGVDANAATDPLGDDFQWATLSVGFANDSFWMPNARLGYRKNLSGSGLAYVGIGATLFRYVNVDISSALDTTTINGTKLPQGLMASIGFQVNW